MRRWLVATGAVTISLGLVAGVASPASAKTHKFAGPAPGSVTCDVNTTLSFSPALKMLGGGTHPTKVKGTLSNCFATNSAVTVTSGKLTGSFASTPLRCATLSSGMASATFTIKWKGAVNGTIGAASYTGRARFNSTNVTSSGEQVVTSGGSVGLSLPGTGNTASATGSFGAPSPNGAAISAFTSDTTAQLTTQCQSPGGIKKLGLTGSFSFTVGVSSINSPTDIAAGSDGNLWFTNSGDNSIGKITTAGVVTDYTDPSIDRPYDIAAGPDGNLWFTNSGGNTIGRITPSGLVSHYSDPTIDIPWGITAGPDGAMWFGNRENGSIGRITTAGAVTNFSGPAIDPAEITTGPDGALWFANYYGNSIGTVTTGGVFHIYTDPSMNNPNGIAAGLDGNLWFTNESDGSIGQITTAGVVTDYPDPSISGPANITAGPDGNLWFTNNNTGTIGQITTSGAVTSFTDPSISGPVGIASGPDGNLWFVNDGDNTIGSISTSGAVSNFTG